MVNTVMIHYPLAPSTGCASCFVTGKKALIITLHIFVNILYFLLIQTR